MKQSKIISTNWLNIECFDPWKLPGINTCKEHACAVEPNTVSYSIFTHSYWWAELQGRDVPLSIHCWRWSRGAQGCSEEAHWHPVQDWLQCSLCQYLQNDHSECTLRKDLTKYASVHSLALAVNVLVTLVEYTQRYMHACITTIDLHIVQETKGNSF